MEIFVVDLFWCLYNTVLYIQQTYALVNNNLLLFSVNFNLSPFSNGRVKYYRQQLNLEILKTVLTSLSYAFMSNAGCVDGKSQILLKLHNLCAAHIGMDGMRIEKEPRQKDEYVYRTS
jgi:hypothetical protein